MEPNLSIVCLVTMWEGSYAKWGYMGETKDCFGRPSSGPTGQTRAGAATMGGKDGSGFLQSEMALIT